MDYSLVIPDPMPDDYTILDLIRKVDTRAADELEGLAVYARLKGYDPYLSTPREDGADRLRMSFFGQGYAYAILYFYPPPGIVRLKGGDRLGFYVGLGDFGADDDDRSVPPDQLYEAVVEVKRYLSDSFVKGWG